MKNETYESPAVTVVELTVQDVLYTSPGTENDSETKIIKI